MRKLVLITVLASGCVLGRNPTARHVAMACDGAFVAGGLGLAIATNHGSSDFGDDIADHILTGVGTGMIVAGLVGLVINLALADDTAARATSSGTSAGTR